jgi:hypothetical protein
MKAKKRREMWRIEFVWVRHNPTGGLLFDAQWDSRSGVYWRTEADAASDGVKAVRAVIQWRVEPPPPLSRPRLTHAARRRARK